MKEEDVTKSWKIPLKVQNLPELGLPTEDFESGIRDLVDWMTNQTVGPLTVKPSAVAGKDACLNSLSPISYLTSYVSDSTINSACATHSDVATATEKTERVIDCESLGMVARFVGEPHHGFKKGGIYPVVKTVGENVVALAEKDFPREIYVDRSEVAIMKIDKLQ